MNADRAGGSGPKPPIAEEPGAGANQIDQLTADEFVIVA
jgi:hypothetical protein